MSTDAFADIVKDFTKEYGVSEGTARRAVEIFLVTAASMPEAEAQREYERTVEESFVRGEEWATELVTKSLEKRVPGFRATYDKALARGVDPVKALMWDHNVPQEAAVEAVRAFQQPTGK
ncbi:hypothetical protein [Streptomyces huiliensis]|uniref:hypothetical protein n=1 Tax=Streptomyces huiliensis TaxID=2876027 RepID=UPI001CC0D261|nr:hypothetical protein [Streptomyces huiliensis]MBZ4319397.1 hypothetical protein [Streptomyces huiliensis]